MKCKVQIQKWHRSDQTGSFIERVRGLLVPLFVDILREIRKRFQILFIGLCHRKSSSGIFLSVFFQSILQFEMTQQHTYTRKNINTSTCLKLIQFKRRKSTADLLQEQIMWRIFQVDFFVTDSVVPQPAKTILIILYCILVTIAGEHHHHRHHYYYHHHYH